MAKVDTLQVNVWEASFAPDDHLAVTRFQISANAQETLTQWSREKAGRNENQPMSVILRGLSELTAWFVPEIAFLRPEFDGALQRTRLSFYFTGDMTLQPGLRQRMQMALQLWVNTLYPEKAAEMRTQIAAAALIDDGWTLFNVACALEPGGACPTARDSLFWDALAARAAQRLAGQSLQFGSGESRVLIPRTSQSSAFEGLELVAFPPKRGANNGLWSEVITLHAATFPERAGAHVLARPSIRNWGSITRYASRNAPRRSLDVFLPAEDAFGHATRRHTSFQFQARRGPDRPDGSPPGVVAYWPHMDGAKIFDLLRRLTNQTALAPDELGNPLVDQEGLWILPRLGSIHKDKYLPGGTGISWPDRKDIGDSLEQALAGGGFTRAAPLTRRTTRHKIQRTDVDHASARRAVIDALIANGGSPELSFYIFHIGEATPERIARLLVERFGSPDERDAGELKWSDGLVIRLRSAAAGVLSEELPLPDLTADEMEGRNNRQLRPLREMKREEARDAVIAAMAAHIAAARQGDHGIACGLVEMPKALRDNPKQDPFQFTRRELARHDILPQVILWDTRTEAELKTTPPRRKGSQAEGRGQIRSCSARLLPHAGGSAARPIT